MASQATNEIERERERVDLYEEDDVRTIFPGFLSLAEVSEHTAIDCQVFSDPGFVVQSITPSAVTHHPRVCGECGWCVCVVCGCGVCGEGVWCVCVVRVGVWVWCVCGCVVCVCVEYCSICTM